MKKKGFENQALIRLIMIKGLGFWRLEVYR